MNHATRREDQTDVNRTRRDVDQYHVAGADVIFADFDPFPVAPCVHQSRDRVGVHRVEISGVIFRHFGPEMIAQYQIDQTPTISAVITATKIDERDADERRKPRGRGLHQ